MKNINISLYRVQNHLPKNRKSGFQDPSKYAPQAPQNRPRRHLDLRGAPRASQGPPWDPPRTPQELPPGPPRTPQKALGPFQDLPRIPKYPPREPSGAPKASQGPPWDPPRCVRTSLQGLPGPLRTPWDLSRNSPGPKAPSQELSEPCSSPQDLFQNRPGLPEQGQNLFMTPQAPSLQPPSLQRPRRDSRSDNN